MSGMRPKEAPEHQVEYHSTCLICPSTEFTLLEGFEESELVQCAHCGLVFCKRVPTDSELVEHYAQYDRDPEADCEVTRQRREELLDEFAAYRETNRLLDVGCGVGFLLNQARARGWETCGTEFSNDAVEMCESNGHEMGYSPLSADDFAAGSFDVVVYTEVIEHINNQVEEFEQVRRLLRPGGLLYVTTPNFDSLARRLLGPQWNIIDYPEHLAYFTPATLRHLFETSGFEVVDIEATGISVTRILNSMQAEEVDGSGVEEYVDKNPCKSDWSVDQILRRGMEESAVLGGVKSAVNDVLDATNLGNTLKAYIEKP